MSITMKMRDWRDLHNQVQRNSAYPSWKIAGMIGDAVRKADAHLPLTERAGEM